MLKLAKLHNDKYLKIHASGQPGWGGVERIANLRKYLSERFFIYDKVPSDGRLLELGCGAGNLSMELAKLGFDVSGVDFSSFAIEWAKENSKRASLNIDFHIANVTNMPMFLNQSFDILYDGNCLHCVVSENSRKLALNEWNRLLKKGGLLFISSLCVNKNTARNLNSHFPSEFDLDTNILSESGYPYRYIPRPEKIVHELEQAGFRIAHQFERTDSPFGHVNFHAIKN